MGFKTKEGQFAFGTTTATAIVAATISILSFQITLSSSFIPTNSYQSFKKTFPPHLPASCFHPTLIQVPSKSYMKSESSSDQSNTGLKPLDSAPACSEKVQEIFHGKSVLLTGASGGLGRALALQLSRCGAGKIVLSGRNLKSLKTVAEECSTVSSSTKVDVIVCDLADSNAVKKLGEESMQLCGKDGIDILINNGGISSRSRFIDTGIEVDELLIKVNYLAGAQLAKAVVPGMIDRAMGSIIWISSVQGLVGIPNRTSYAASKFAVQGYCESLRAELANSGVGVHVVSPGYIRTNLSKSAIRGDGGLYNKMDETTANGADPNDVAVEILESVAVGQTELVVAAGLSAKVAIWLRFFFPSALQKILAMRYEKSQK